MRKMRRERSSLEITWKGERHGKDNKLRLKIINVSFMFRIYLKIYLLTWGSKYVCSQQRDTDHSKVCQKLFRD